MQNEASGNIARVTVKVPPFWRANPELWFKQIESQFILASVTTEITKFHHIVSVLQPEELEIVGDIMQDPSAERPYEALRRRLCSQYAQNQRRGIEILVSSTAAYPRAADLNDKLERLAEMADGIMAASKHTISIQAVSSEEASIQATLMEISSRLSRLEARSRSRSQESGRRFRQRETNREEGNPSHCWYDQHFKRRAQ
ncbi:hypothetical protein HNY73_005010 [Argiope bruennichi]|uniref:DUF7041 domain-containing protein n=1 Tax=Argiope bruennichi TaxID=94029 RepID=A0A8T0FTB4_ARGBR|nr:hypothetical protein HNY73_005010 [Argiope bruennichi]